MAKKNVELTEAERLAYETMDKVKENRKSGNQLSKVYAQDPKINYCWQMQELFSKLLQARGRFFELHNEQRDQEREAIMDELVGDSATQAIKLYFESLQNYYEGSRTDEDEALKIILDKYSVFRFLKDYKTVEQKRGETEKSSTLSDKINAVARMYATHLRDDLIAPDFRGQTEMYQMFSEFTRNMSAEEIGNVYNDILERIISRGSGASLSDIYRGPSRTPLPGETNYDQVKDIRKMESLTTVFTKIAMEKDTFSHTNAKACELFLFRNQDGAELEQEQADNLEEEVRRLSEAVDVPKEQPRKFGLNSIAEYLKGRNKDNDDWDI